MLGSNLNEKALVNGNSSNLHKGHSNLAQLEVLRNLLGVHSNQALVKLLNSSNHHNNLFRAHKEVSKIKDRIHGINNLLKVNLSHNLMEMANNNSQPNLPLKHHLVYK